MANHVILTVHKLKNAKNQYRFGMSEKDKKALKGKKIRQVKSVSIELEETIHLLDNSIKTFSNHGNLVNPKIDEWIKSNSMHLKKSSKPVKLIFEQKIYNGHHYYKLYPNQNF